MDWLEDSELRVGLGCMRLADDERGRATIAAALDAGVTVLDTAHAYLGNEALVASVLRERGARARVVTKAGMARPDGGWRPDGRATAIRRDCEESLRVLGAIDLLLLHAPDPKTSWRTSLRALRKIFDERLVPRVGVSNVTLGRLEEAMGEAPITAIEVELSPFELDAILGGVVGRAIEKGVWVIAHSPFGGPELAAEVARDETLSEMASRLGVSAHVVALAGIAALGDRVVPVPGATRPETAREAAVAARLRLDDDDRERLRARFRAGSMEARKTATPPSGREVVVLAGLPGAGKTTISSAFVSKGYERISRDERGGSLQSTARVLDRLLGEGSQSVLLDATYATRASRREVLEVAWRHPVAVRCIYLETPIPQAQANVAQRMLEVHGRLLEPEEMERGRGPDTLSPRHFFRMVRALEPPGADEGFSTLEVVPFERRAIPGRENAARFVQISAVVDDRGAAIPSAREAIGDSPLFYGWSPDGETIAAIERTLRAAYPDAPVAWCRHGAGPPVCWCRPPLPGLVLWLAQQANADVTKSVVVGADAVDRRLADAIGARFEDLRDASYRRSSS